MEFVETLMDRYLIYRFKKGGCKIQIQSRYDCDTIPALDLSLASLMSAPKNLWSVRTVDGYNTCESLSEKFIRYKRMLETSLSLSQLGR